MDQEQGPHYELEQIKHLVRTRRYYVTTQARLTAGRLELDEEDIFDCVLALTSADYCHSLPSETRPDHFQDVYQPTYQGRQLYVKLQAPPDEYVAIISFKENTSR